MKKIVVLSLMALTLQDIHAVDLRQCRIVVSSKEQPLVKKVAGVLGDDIERVTGKRPRIVDATERNDAHQVVVSTVGNVKDIAGLTADVDYKDIIGDWERYKIMTRGNTLYIIGSDVRGAAYGMLHISERIGVNPWYWWADIPVDMKTELEYSENFTSKSPSVKYRGIFINDEDWGMKPWSATTMEPELGDIGPKTYDKVCELILRLKGNMLAPAMHSCTGAFYSHPGSQMVADSWGIMITTSHCEPLLFNNAAKSEWNKERDGEWNYLTNKETILRKFNDRLAATSQYDNIYTMGMRGLHDEAMKGSADPKVRARTLEQVFADQRKILQHHKRKLINDIPQIFVPYKETLDIYDAGLNVPDDITLVWPDDNYGYMKRVCNTAERKRSGGSGVYYHLSYLGTPHDNLWLSTTAPALMYEELRKAYDAGADRYWLLNVGDIKPMEIAMTQFFEMAWDFGSFSYSNANRWQARWLAGIYGAEYEKEFQELLDCYYRLAWDRKPEFMGYEIEWDSEENVKLHDTDFSRDNGTWQRRLDEYKGISDHVCHIMNNLPEKSRPSFFEMLGYSVKSAYQMNRKFLMAQANHETGSACAAKAALEAQDSLRSLIMEYNTMLNGKWNQMMSQIPPGYVARYHLIPELVDAPTTAYKLPAEQHRKVFANMVPLNTIDVKLPFRVIEGMGTDWHVLQLGEPLDEVQDAGNLKSGHIDLDINLDKLDGDSIRFCISVVPVWPVSANRSNRFGISLDGCKPVVLENRFEEWSYPWKLQVLDNRKDFIITLPADRNRRRHVLTLIIGDPGQMVQKISYE